MSAATIQTDAIGIILAAGDGSRMRSRIPKPLHLAAGKELIRYPVELLAQCGVAHIVVVASPANHDSLAAVLGGAVNCAIQPVANGTADAVACALAALDAAPDTVVVLAADTPLVRAESLRRLMDEHASAAGRCMTILSATDVFAHDLGQIQRAASGDSYDVGPVSAIVEAADRPDSSTGPAEVNTGVYCFDGNWLTAAIAEVTPSPSGERYLTALVRIAADAGRSVVAAPIALPDEAMGVNDRLQLSAVETVLRDRVNCRWMREGVTIIDTATTYIDSEVTIAPDTVILPNTMLAGRTVIGQDCQVGPNSVVRDSIIADRCRIVASVIEGATIHSDVDIGPYSHLRPDTVIETGVHLGNYVEVKNSRIGPGVAAGHFCYLGDSHVGANVNIGAGTITCNYDGVDKHQTTIGDGAFIGSDTMLIAPINVGPGATTGAGSVVTSDVPPSGRVVGVPARLLPPKPTQ
ncbi:MAG: UDP-N-acetylglucosamine diphosphorylase/glucosamine-1-phosphate N-acetyltransferase [Chloroflexi bacterium]|nr:UDP-N-acetylglucosamine diphosphorylase/glucosamine-1-phosphate N-acetyltransferase [Chloroflexota bacterium]MYD48726.1 UDP-N-acetylglucosamine diphosphorylase/glucosamine-1-phosphate N-acetyltransferase [Chloroflexota bacterium]